ncbi:MAG: thioredoxin family protein [Bacteroidia bacterium]|nr:thioredoxin family protein [Bacteroidia bacterium]
MKKITTLLMVSAILLASFTAADGYKVGDKAADFRLKNIDNKMVSLADHKDAKGIILVFTCNHCPFAKKYESRIMALDKKYKSKGFPVIAISPNDPTVVAEDSFENMQKLAAEKKYTFPYLFDETQLTAKAYGAAKTPHVFILQKVNAEYIVRYIGAIDDNSDDEVGVKEKYVESAVDNILSGKTVNPGMTKAIGCSIKWKKQ